MFAHEALQVCEAAQVFDLLLAFFVAFAGVPEFVGFDETDDASTAVAGEGFRGVVRVIGDEVGAVLGRLCGLDCDVAVCALRGAEGGVHFGGVEALECFLQGTEVVRLVGGWI